MEKMSRSEAGKLGAEKTKLTVIKIMEARHKAYEANPVLCKYCSTVIAYDRMKRGVKFCNKTCSATFNNMARIKKSTIKVTRVSKNTTPLVTCMNCMLLAPEYKNGRSFCSHQCFVSKNKHDRLIEWLAGGKIASKLSVKSYLLKEQNGQCASCSISTTWNDKPLVFDLEHKDGDSSNNSRVNLELLCPNCHSQTATYKGKNKGKGRHHRMQRYYDGKSY